MDDYKFLVYNVSSYTRTKKMILFWTNMLLNVITMSRYTYHGTLIPTKANVIHCGFCVVALSKHKITFFSIKIFNKILHMLHITPILYFFFGCQRYFFYLFIFRRDAWCLTLRIKNLRNMWIFSIFRKFIEKIERTWMDRYSIKVTTLWKKPWIWVQEWRKYIYIYIFVLVFNLWRIRRRMCAKRETHLSWLWWTYETIIL